MGAERFIVKTQNGGGLEFTWIVSAKWLFSLFSIFLNLLSSWNYFRAVPEKKTHGRLEGTWYFSCLFNFDHMGWCLTKSNSVGDGLNWIESVCIFQCISLICILYEIFCAFPSGPLDIYFKTKSWNTKHIWIYQPGCKIGPCWILLKWCSKCLRSVWENFSYVILNSVMKFYWNYGNLLYSGFQNNIVQALFLQQKLIIFTVLGFVKFTSFVSATKVDYLYN